MADTAQLPEISTGTRPYADLPFLYAPITPRCTHTGPREDCRWYATSGQSQNGRRTISVRHVDGTVEVLGCLR
jgi:hypothetical protein